MAHPIVASVGQGGKNRPDDVRAVQRLLTEVARLTGLRAVHPGPVDGRAGEGTVGAIEAAQRLLVRMRRPDGLVTAPSRLVPMAGLTWRRLDALLAIEATPAGFPLPFDPGARTPRWPFDSGMRAFGARRSGGRRAHAGCDLYAPLGTPVLAVADGVVRRVAPFYAKTDAVEVEHHGVGRDGAGARFVVRYGEVHPGSCPLKPGDRVSRGEPIAEVGHLVGVTAPSDMLHFELFDGTADGPLSADEAVHPDGRRFRRRRDLVDPTPFLKRWRLP